MDLQLPSGAFLDRRPLANWGFVGRFVRKRYSGGGPGVWWRGTCGGTRGHVQPVGPLPNLAHERGKLLEVADYDIGASLAKDPLHAGAGTLAGLLVKRGVLVLREAHDAADLQDAHGEHTHGHGVGRAAPCRPRPRARRWRARGVPALRTRRPRLPGSGHRERPHRADEGTLPQLPLPRGHAPRRARTPPLNERQGFTLMQDGVAMQICNFSDKRLASVAIEPHCLTLTATMRLAR